MDPVAARKLTDALKRATCLHERLRASAHEAVTTSDTDDPMARWDAALEGHLDRRLAYDGLTREAATRLVAYAGQPSDTRWMDVIGIALANTTEPQHTPNYIDPASPIAFEDLLLPFVETGRAMIARDLAQDIFILSDNAWATLERALLALLSRLALQTFCSEFALHQGLAGSLPWQGAAGTGSYIRFVTHARNGGLHDMFCAYPVLAKLLATTVLNWSDAHATMVTRVRDDWPLLQSTFALNDAPCMVQSIAPYRSDLHDSGCSVVILELSGSLIVYKPRPLAMEQAFGDILAWATARGFSRPYRHTLVLTRGGYGWMGYASATPCANPAQVDAFYARVGGLICLTSLLQATDIHYENLVASGDQPILVDAETLFHPRLPAGIAMAFGGQTVIVQDDVARALSDSGWFPPPDDPDFSALGADDSVATCFPAASCIAVNSDHMAFVYEPFRAPRRQNIPTLNGHRESAACHQAAIVAGFREMLRLVLRDRESLLGLIRGFGDPHGRVIVRSSNTYGLLLQASLAPEMLRDGAARGVMFEGLRRKSLHYADRPMHWSILDAETDALERMDVPRIVSSDAEAARCWPSPVSQVLDRIARLSERDIGTHLRQLRHHLARLKPLRADDPSPTSAQESEMEACHG